VTDEEIAIKLEAHTHEIKSLKHRMDGAEEIIKEVHNIATSVQLLAQESKSTGDKVDNLAEKLESLEAKPIEDWSKVKVSAITAVVTALMTAAVAAIINIL